MRLAADEITIRLEGSAPLFLRPSLRAALRLERRHGFPALYRGVAEGSVTILSDIIGEAIGDPAFVLPIPAAGLAGTLAALALPLFDFVMMLHGADEDAAAPSTDEAARITFAEAYERLFRVATGWLRWTPETAWNATPREITAAFEGLLESRGVNPQAGSSLDEKVGAMMRKLDADDRAEAREKDRERRKLKLRLKKGTEQ